MQFGIGIDPEFCNYRVTFALTRRFNYILIESSACVSIAFNIARYPRISRNKRSMKSPGQASYYCYATESVFPLGSRISRANSAR